MYASPSPSLRGSFWLDLNKLYIRYPWVLIVNFNCTLAREERSSPPRGGGGGGVLHQFLVLGT